MKVPTSLFLIFSLVLTNLFVAGYAVFINYFQSGYEIKSQIHHLESRLNQAEVEKKMAENRLLDLEQTVAAVLPSQKKMIAENWGTRPIHLGEQLRAPASLHPVNLSEPIFEKGKRLFTQGKYSLAFREFESVREKYPASDRIVECNFLMLESAFMQKDFKKTADLADLMVTHYPENRLTGYALLRLAQVSEINSQFDEAVALYRIVQKNFNDEKLREQARVLERRILIE